MEPDRGVAAPRSVRRRVLSQNFLVDRDEVRALVAGAEVGEGHLVVDIGAGNGLITAELARRGARVVAIERDPALAAKLRHRFGDKPRVRVVEANVLTVPMPAEDFRVVANIPFGITTKILRRLLSDLHAPLVRADLIVQAEVARKRAAPGRGTLLNASWEPWFAFELGPRIPASAFRPRPRVDAAVLRLRRRDPPLLEPGRRAEYLEFIELGFTGAGPTVRRALSRLVPPSRFAVLAAELGFSVDALPPHLDVHQWIGLFLAVRGRRPGAARSGGRPTGRQPHGRVGQAPPGATVSRSRR